MAKPDGKAIFEATRQECVRGMLMAGVLSLFLTVLQMMVPLFSIQAYDRVMTSHSVDTLIVLSIITAVGLVLYGLLDFVRGRVFNVISHGMSRRLGASTFEAVVSDALVDPNRSSGQAVRDLNELRLFMSGSAPLLPLDIAVTPLFLAILFMLHPVYGIVAVIGSAVLVLMSLLTEVMTRRPLSAANEAAVRSFGEVAAASRHAEVIEAMGMMPAILRRWQRRHGSMLHLLLAGNDRGKALASLSRAVRLLLQITIIASGVLLVLDRSASPGSMLAAVIITGRVLMPFEHLIDGWRQWVFAHAAYGRLRELLTGTRDRRQSIPLPRPEGRLKIDRLVFIPPGQDRAVLKGVSFQIEPGEMIGIVGPSGAGKSTLARLLVGLWEPTAGGIYLDDHNVFLWNRENFGHYVGYLPQTVSLLEGTVRENIARMGDADPHEVIEAAKKADVHEMIGRLPFGYDTPVGDGGYSLSGGQRQRIALARALFGNPRLLVLDEPNSNLDQAGEAALVRALGEARKNGTTVVMIAHRPSVMNAVDKILVLRDGVIDQFGSRQDILKRGAAGGAVVVPHQPAGGPRPARIHAGGEP